MNNNPMDMLKPQLQQIKRQMRQIQSMSSPQAALNQLLLNNPQVSNALQFIKQNGGNPQIALQNLARQMGIDPNEIIKELQS